MNTSDPTHQHSTQEGKAARRGPDLEFDIDLKMAQSLSDTRAATDAIRLRTQAIRTASGSDSQAGERVASPPQGRLNTHKTGSGLELETSDFVIELERLANASYEAAGDQGGPDTPSAEAVASATPHVEDPTDPTGDLLEDMRAEYVRLTETIDRLQGAAAEAETAMETLRLAMARLEEATASESLPDRDLEAPTPADDAHTANRVEIEDGASLTPDADPDLRRTALATLSNLAA